MNIASSAGQSQRDSVKCEHFDVLRKSMARSVCEKDHCSYAIASEQPGFGFHCLVRIRTCSVSSYKIRLRVETPGTYVSIGQVL